MIEDEAKTKACCGPQILTLILALGKTDGRVELGDNPGQCIGSACMAWRWENDYERRWDLPADKPPEGEGWNRVEAIGGVAHWVRQTKTPNGHCGLAGSPL